ncbi:MAG: (deoxy)nucleoside triphosphate pyrophosphohydrolase [Desulforhopalus sp.]|nr:(deoxy)nucleoside triphosphate pyrophosphohydrolase [Desulforhopalus sp.]
MLDVAAGIIVKNGCVLAARRRPGLHLAGYWEFPGGKVEPGETPQQCLRRELLEEFGIYCEVSAFLGESIHDYGSKVVRLLGFLTVHTGGTFLLRDHDQIIWLSPEELPHLCWAPADIPLVKLLIKQLAKEALGHARD